MTAWEVAAAVARAVYSLGLLAIGLPAVLGAWRYGRTALRVLADLATSITFAATVAREHQRDRDAVERIEAATGRIEGELAALRHQLRQ